jgi:hypothetical protein
VKPFVVLFKEESYYSAIVYAESEEDCIKKAGKLSTTIKSSSDKLSLDDRKITTEILPN